MSNQNSRDEILLTQISNIISKPFNRDCSINNPESTTFKGNNTFRTQSATDVFVKSVPAQNSTNKIQTPQNLTFKGKYQLPVNEIKKLNLKYSKIINYASKEEIIEDMGRSYIEELKQIIRKAEPSSAEIKKKKEFYGDMNHEIFGSYIQTQQLKMISLPENADKKEVINTCNNIGMHTFNTVERYQSFIDNGLDNPNKQVPIKSIFNLVKESLSEKLKSKNIKLNIKNELLLQKDKNLTNEGYKNYTIMANLLENATKYSPENSQINAEFKKIKGKLFLSVSDKGIGIPTEDQKSVLVQGIRGSNVGEIKGTGHGLYRVYRILENKNLPIPEIKSPLYPKEPIYKGTQINIPLIISE